MIVVIAEKKMLGIDIARALCNKTIPDSASLPQEGSGYVVLSCAGHLLELAAPEDINDKWQKPWREDTLPIYIEPWDKRPAEGKEALLNKIGEYLPKATTVIHAGDPDDEGQLIVDEVLDYFGYMGKVKRVYVNDNIEANIKKAFADLKDNDECRKDGLGAQARQLADAAFGFNETRLATTRLGQLMSVGRVQTPTLGLVVMRDQAIASHLQTMFYELYADVALGTDTLGFKLSLSKELLGDEKHLYVRSVLEEIEEKVKGTACAITTTVKEERVAPPLPYNLTVLIEDMSERYKYPASKTQDITQALRDKYKAITYNRTDCQYLKTEHFSEAPSVLRQAMSNCNLAWELDFSLVSKAFNDKFVSAHHAIIPQDTALDIKRMDEAEKNVYCAITERYALQFISPEISDVSLSTFGITEGTFKYKSVRIKEQGWKKYASKVQQEDTQQDEEKPWVEAGEHIGQVEGTRIDEKETTPPKPYTEGTLIKDMASISKYVKDKRIVEILKLKDDGKKGEHGGIGTTATRSAIIEKLKEHGYIESVKGKVRSTALGQEFYALLPDVIKRADTTALWWLIQQDIVEGKKDVYEVQRSVISVFNSHKDSSYKNCGAFGKPQRNTIGTCPKCGADVAELGKTYSCTSNRSEKQDDGSWVSVAGCGFKLWDSAFGKKLSKNTVAELLKNLTTKSKVKGLKSKAGKAFDARLALDKDTGKISPVFD